jgi:hypothetical protein
MRRASVPNGSLMWGRVELMGQGTGPSIHERGCRVEEGPHQCHVRRPGGFRVPGRKLIWRDVLGLRPWRDLRLDGEAGSGPFAEVQVNGSLTFDFAHEPEPCGGPVSTGTGRSHHHAFHVSEAEFEAIFGRVKAKVIPYGSDPFNYTNRQINTRPGRAPILLRGPVLLPRNLLASPKHVE